jgi:hypothetical protein
MCCSHFGDSIDKKLHRIIYITDLILKALIWHNSSGAIDFVPQNNILDVLKSVFRDQTGQN